MVYTVVVKNQKFHICYGLYPEEQLVENTIEVDAEISVYLKEKALPMIDYTLVIRWINEAVNKSEKTLEDMLSTLSETMEEHDKNAGWKIEIRKLHPPINAKVDYTAVRLEKTIKSL